jgi:hypothetical protein
MDTVLLRLFQRQVADQCFAAILASETAQSALNPPTPPGAPGMAATRSRPHQDVFWASIQNCLTAATNISRSCWGEKGKQRKERKPLRKSLGLNGESPLKPISRPHNFEHVDERIEEWFAHSTTQIYVDRMIGIPDVLGGVADDEMFRVFDTTTADVVFWGMRYPLKAIMDEVTRVYPVALAEGAAPE